jgi:oligoribonuclease NrnB/cAMP/cGMP phosphodiesterase (DHH superfamily)
MTKIFHHSDADGFASAAIINLVIPDAWVFSSNYNKPVPFSKLIKGEDVYVVDMTFSEQDMKVLDENYNLIWIDHHENVIKSAEEKGFNPKGRRDSSDAACVLTWNYMFPDAEVPLSVKFIADNDTWTHSMKESKIFVQGLMTMDVKPSKQTKWLWEKLLRDDKELLSHILERGLDISNFITLENAILIDDLGYDVQSVSKERTTNILVANCRSNSVLFDSKVDPTYHHAVMNYAWIGSVDSYRYGIYQIDPTLDVSEFAREHGGNGHKAAAGFTSVHLPYLKRVDKNGIEHNTRMIQGSMPNREPASPRYIKPIEDYLNKSNLAKAYLFSQEKITLWSQRFKTIFEGYRAVAVNYALPRYDIFISDDMTLQDILITFVWTNCGKYRVVVYPILQSIDMSIFEKKYDAFRVNNSWWMYVDELPFKVI